MARFQCYRVGIAATPKVVDANHQEHHGGLAFSDGFQSVENAIAHIATDAAVLAVDVLEQLDPFATIGEAVAEEDNVVFRGWQRLEKQFALVVISTELARDLCHRAMEWRQAERQEDKEKYALHGVV